MDIALGSMQMDIVQLLQTATTNVSLWLTYNGLSHSFIDIGICLKTKY